MSIQTHVITLFTPLLKTCSTGHLQNICKHSFIILYFFLYFSVVYVFAWVSSINSTSFKALPKSKKSLWSATITSTLFAISVLIASNPLFYDKALLDDRVFGSSEYANIVTSYAVAYFIFDTMLCLVWVRELGFAFLFHGVACLFSFGIGMLPFVQAFAPALLLFEASTIFLNIHWFCDKTGRSGSTLQFINGLLLLGVFFVVRVCFGTYKLAEAIWILVERRKEIEIPFLVEFYVVAGGGIAILNLIWFRSMIRAVASRFKAPPPKSGQTQSKKSN